MNELLAAFEEDHRVLTQGLHAIEGAVTRGDLGEAVKLAEQIDRRAGPHIVFEETCFYPHLKTILGDEFVARLYREHRAVQGALATLRTVAAADLGPDAVSPEALSPEALSPEAKAKLIADLRLGLEHTMSCGSLASHLRSLDEVQQAQMLERLVELRARPVRWTELGGGKSAG